MDIRRRASAGLAAAMLTGFALLAYGPAAVAAPAPHETALASFTAGGHGPGRCAWHANGSKSGGHLALRLRVDHCRRYQLRIRAAGQGVLPDRFYAGNWIVRRPQLTSIDISPNVFSNFGWDQQYCWRLGKGCRHKGKVRFISADNGARPVGPARP